MQMRKVVDRMEGELDDRALGVLAREEGPVAVYDAELDDVRLLVAVDPDEFDEMRQRARLALLVTRYTICNVPLLEVPYARHPAVHLVSTVIEGNARCEFRIGELDKARLQFFPSRWLIDGEPEEPTNLQYGIVRHPSPIDPAWYELSGALGRGARNPTVVLHCHGFGFEVAGRITTPK